MTVCRNCDAPVERDARFCMQCGHPLPGRRISQADAVVSGDIDVSLVAELKQEKERLDRQLRGLLDVAEKRDLTAAEREEWKRAHKLWERVRAQLTRQMQYLSARTSRERRSTERRRGERRKQQIAIDVPDRRREPDRRRTQRRSGVDRREPFPTDTPSAE